jgi:hypothetical protein
MNFKVSLILMWGLALMLIVLSYCAWKKEDRIMKRVKAGGPPGHGVIITHLYMSRYGLVTISYKQDGIEYEEVTMNYRQYDSLLAIK